MKKTIYAAVLFLTIGIAATSCKKDNTTKPSPTIVGYWVGKYGNGSGAATSPYAFLFKADGSVNVYANKTETALASKAVGTYSVAGTTVNTTFTYPSAAAQYSTISYADSSFTTMSGTWGSGLSTTGNTFFLNKK